MTPSGSPPPSPFRVAFPAAFWEVSLALFILTWRFTWYPLERLPQDAIAIIAAYWVFSAVAHRTRAWPAVTVATMAVLLVIYGWAQIPLITTILRFAA